MEYDDALFAQKCKAIAKDGKVTLAQAIDAFWATAWDLKLAIHQMDPDVWDRAQVELAKNLMPGIARTLRKNTGLEIILNDEREEP